MDRKPERWALLNVVLLTAVLVLLGPHTWLGRLLGYSALLLIVGWQFRVAWAAARVEGLTLVAAITRGLTTIGYLAVCAATIVFANEYAEHLEATIAFVLYGFQIYFFRSFTEHPEHPAAGRYEEGRVR
jgi:hypothetical protein